MTKFTSAFAAGLLAAVAMTPAAALAATPKDTLVIATSIDDIVSIDPAEAFEFSGGDLLQNRSEEHTSELQSLMRISYAVFCLKHKTQHNQTSQRLHNRN